MRQFTIRDVAVALLLAASLVLVYFLSPGSTGVFIYQEF
jgi:hypothetical protein